MECTDCGKKVNSKYAMCDSCWTKIVDDIILHSTPDEQDELIQIKEEIIGNNTKKPKRKNPGAKTLG